jgi:AcrR family transcriptional regulator
MNELSSEASGPEQAPAGAPGGARGGRGGELDGLPAHLVTAWGLRGRPTKGPKPSLSLERIVAAGVKVAKSEGLAAVSMSRVAAQLGASTMSLYRYVASKDELLALMMDAAVGPPPDGTPPGERWREGLTRFAWAERDGLLRQPWVLRVPLSAPPMMPNQMAWLEWGLTYLRGTGLSAQRKMSVILTISNYVWRTTTIESDLIEGAKAAGSTVEEMAAGLGQVLAKLADPRRFPEVHAAIAEGAFDDAEVFVEDEFTFGLERILDGVEVLIRGRAERRSGKNRRPTRAG